MPRSSHSVTSYFSCNPTGSPQRLQKVTMFLLNVPHLWHSTSPRWNGSVLMVAPQAGLRQVERRWCRPFRFPHLHSPFPIALSSNSSRLKPRKSEIGKTLLNTLSSPVSSRSLGSRSICRNRSYDFFWTSIKFGIGMEVLILEKSMRSRAAPLSGVIIVHPSSRAGSGGSKKVRSASQKWLGAGRCPLQFVRIRGLGPLPDSRVPPFGSKKIARVCKHTSGIIWARRAKPRGSSNELPSRSRGTNLTLLGPALSSGSLHHSTRRGPRQTGRLPRDGQVSQPALFHYYFTS